MSRGMAREETKMSKIVNEEVLFGAKRASSQTKNLCWLAGFHNPKHMRVTFPQITGVTPSLYRERKQRNG